MSSLAAPTKKELFFHHSYIFACKDTKKRGIMCTFANKFYGDYITLAVEKLERML